MRAAGQECPPGEVLKGGYSGTNGVPGRLEGGRENSSKSRVAPGPQWGQYDQVPAELLGRAAGQECPPERCLKVGTRGPTERLEGPRDPRRVSPEGSAWWAGRELRGPPLRAPGGPWWSLAAAGRHEAPFWGPGAGRGGPRGSVAVVPGRGWSEVGQGPPRTPAGGRRWSLGGSGACFSGLAPALGVRGGPRWYHRVRGGETVPTVPCSSARPKGRLSRSPKGVLRACVSAIFEFFCIF